MLRSAQINMPETQLMVVKDKSYFAVKRYDRINNERLHVHSLAGLCHANFRMPDFDYEKLLRVSLMLTKNPEDAIQVYRQMVFNILANNQDDHTKNFSFMMDKRGVWRLSPAYDVTFNYCHGGEQSMAVSGFGKNVPDRVFYQLGVICDLDRQKVRRIFADTFEALSQWPVIAKELGIGSQNRKDIQESFNDLYKQYVTMVQ